MVGATGVLINRAASERREQAGFTIVELLIVIIVIAILAAIVIVAYTGIQQRATNANIISAANNSIRMVQAYVSANNAYPATSNACISSGTGCSWGGGAVAANAGFDSNMTSVGSLPRTVPQTDASNYGIIYNYVAGRTYNGAVQPLTLIYFLKGYAVNCGQPVTNSGGSTMTSTTNLFTATTSTTTTCVVTIAGP